MQMHRAGRLAEFPLLGPEDVFDNRYTKGDGCWLWHGTKHAYGYGVFLLPGDVPVRAHRYAYERVHGPIPDGLVVMHSCDNPPCVNPAHLSLGTRDDNNRDMSQKRRNRSGATHHWTKLTDEQVQEIRQTRPKTQSHSGEVRSGRIHYFQHQDRETALLLAHG
ncbi:MAG: HNH endonuclease [Flavobacteriales bacterium]|nr:HNH endonuclease [Flavobacteriales bacterium]